MVNQLNTACLIIDVTFAVLGSVFCFGRLCSRLMSVKEWRGLMMWSDICMIIAWVFSVAETVTMWEVTKLGHYGYHDKDLMHMSTDDTLLEKWRLVSGLFYNPILGFIKASMILLYLRLGGTKRGVRIPCYILLFVSLGLAVSSTIAAILQCWPIAYNWDNLAMDLAAQKAQNATEPGMTPFGMAPTGFKNGKYVTGGKCFNRVDFILIISGLAILTDFLILCIPVYMVYDLRMRPKKKLIVILILCLGVCITAVSITRLVFSYRLFYSSTENSYSVSSTISQIETGLALVTGCIPDLFPMIRRWFPKFLRPDSEEMQPNPYPYVSGSGSAYSRRLRKVFSPSGSKNLTSKEETIDDTFRMDTFNWRGDALTKGEVRVKGRASPTSLTDSQEAMIEDSLSKPGGIVKTTHFIVQEAHISNGEKQWSNI